MIKSKLLLFSLNWVLITSCATVVTPVDQTFDPLQLQAILGEPANLGQVADILALNDELKAYVDTYVDRNWTSRRKLEKLREMIFSDEMLDLEYDTTRTRTAIETFEARRGNCLSMTNLYIAMARHAGMDARYHIVPVLPWWDRSDNTMIWNEHINATGKLRHDSHYVLDFIPEPPTAVEGQDKTVSDRYAQALYHNNLGAEALLNSRLEEALKQLRLALTIEPGLADAWNNMGIAQRRVGRDDLAEASLKHAISLDARHYTAMSNLLSHYLRRKDVQSAEYYRKKIRRHRASNPYYQFTMGARALDEGDYKLAENKLKKAIRLRKNEPEFYQLLHVVYDRLGNTKKSLKSRQLAERYRTQIPQTRQGTTVRVISDPKADRFLNFRSIVIHPR